MKRYYPLVGILIFALLIRFVYLSDMHYTSEEIKDMTNEYGHRYPYQFDGFAFVNAAYDSEHIDLWGVHFYYVHKWFPKCDIAFVMKFVAMAYFCLTISLFYFLCLFLLKDDLVSAGVTLMLAVCPIYLNNSYFGYLDRNVINQFLKLAMVFCFFLCMKKWVFFPFFLIVSFAYAYTWGGWFITVVILSLSLVSYFAVNVRDKKRIMFVVLPMLVVFVFLFDKLCIIKKYVLKTDIRYKVISEIHPPEWNLGFLIALGVITYFLIHYAWKHKEDWRSHLVVVWFCSTLFGSLLSARHTFYFMMPLFLAIGFIFINLPCLHNDIYLKLAALLMGMLAVFYVVDYSFPTEMDSAIFESMKFIEANTSKDTNILSLWSYGIFYEVYSDRSVVYRSVTPSVFSIYSAFVTDNETESAKILNSIVSDFVVVFNSKDLIYNSSSALFAEREFSENSVMYKGVYGELGFPFEKLHCSESVFKKICVYGVIS